MAFKFDPSTAKAENTFDPSTAEAEKPAGMLRKVADKGLGFASGAVGATKAIADAAGAGNVVSGALGGANESINSLLSDEAKADQVEQSAIMDGAKGKGVWEGVKAGAQAFGVAPVQTAVQGLGSIVPVLAGGLAGLPGAAATGISMGAGTAKGAIYDRIKKEGGTEDQAIKAQEYGGANTDQIALGGALGAADSLTGVSRIAGGMVRNAVGKPIVQAATQGAERGVFGRAGMGMLGEMPLEAAQGGQEQVAANMAAQRAGYQADTWDNVASNATLEALASAGPGAAFGAMDTKPVAQTPPPAQPPAGQTPTGGPGLLPAPTAPAAPPLTQAANIAQPGTAPVVDQTAPATAPPIQSQQPAAPLPTPAEQAGINANDGPLSAAAATAVNSGITTITAEPTQQEIDPVEAARQEYRTQTALLQQQEDDIAYQAYLEALNESESAIDEAPGETVAAVAQFTPTQEIDIFADYADLSDDDFFAQMGATPEETADAIANQPSNPQASDENLAGPSPDVATSPSPSAPAVDAKAVNLARIQAANRPQPTTLGTQTTATAGPGFGINDALGMSNVKNTAQGTDTPPAQAPGEAPQAVAGDAATTGDVPGSANTAVESDGLIDNTPTATAPASAPTGVTSTPGLTKTEQSKADLEHLFGLPEKRAKAIERIAKGTAYFSKPLKAQEFIAKNGLKDTHQSIKTARGWDIVAKNSQPQGTTSEKATEAQPAQVESAVLPPELSAKLQEAHKAHGRDVTQAKVQKAYDRTLNEVLTGTGNNGGVKYKIKPIQMAELKRKLKRLENDLSLFGIQPTGTTNEPQTSVAQQTSQKGSQPQGTSATTDKPAADSGVAATGKAEVAPVDGKARNSPPMQELNGFKVGDTVDVPSRTTGRSKITRLYTTRLAGFSNPEPMATIEHSGGKLLDLNLSSLVAVQDKPEIVVDKAEMRPYRKPDGSVGYEAVPIQEATPAEPVAKPQSTSPVIQDFIDGNRNDAPTIEKVAAEKPAKPDPLTEKEKAAKAKMFNALGKLAALAGKNTRMNWTQEEEQQILPIVIELFDGAMDLGAVTFQKAVRYVREFIASGIDQETADSIPFETLQGAYIATSGRHKDKAVTPKREVAAFDSLQELENSAEKADTDTKDTTNATRTLDSAGQGPLGGIPADSVRGTSAVGATDAGADGRSGPDTAGDRNADGAGVLVQRGVGNDAGAVPVSTRGGRGKRGSAGQRGVQADGGSKPGNEAVLGVGGLLEDSAPKASPNAAPIEPIAFDPQDFVIEDDFALGEGGAKAKFKGNVAAIKLIAQLDTENRLATPSEQRVLAAYVGWGGLAQAFDANNSDWSKEYAELNGLMSEDDYADARTSTRYAHYTSREVIQDGIYAALKHMGFNGGRALEGGAGVGNFIGLMPIDMRSASRFTAIEREPFSAKIAKHLYPKQIVKEADFTEFVGNDDYYDIAVGNPPFASDPQVDRSGRKHLSGLSLHNYFFAKEVDMLREGGILAQVVTNSFMDAATDTARSYISDKTKFLGAIRLPNNAFSKNAGTEVTTDIIFLQKRPESEWGGRAAKADAKQWLNIKEITDAEGRKVPLNQYFIDHPEMMLGKFGAYGTMYRGESPALVQNPGQDTAALLKEAVARLPSNVYVDLAVTKTAAIQDAFVKALTNPTVQEGGFFEEDGKLFQRITDIAGEARGKEITPETMWTAKTKLGDAGLARIKSLSAMRLTVRSLLSAELSNDPAMDALRKTLNEQYDSYTKDHGRINDPATLRVFDDDPDFPLLASLEHGYTPAIGIAAAKSMGIKPVPSKATKGPIFTQRVIDSKKQVAKAETPADALAVSMAERGKLDSSYIGELLGRDPDEVLQELASGEKPLLFKDPATGEYALRDAYLSGNVRAKLVQAKQAGMYVNIKALEEVQPEDVGAHEINARIGSPWVPESIYSDFAKSLFGDGTTSSIKYVKETAGYSAYINAGNSTAETNTWGTTDYPGTAILSALLNNKPIKVVYKDSDGNLRTDAEATEKANIKAQDMRSKFQDWIFTDSERAETLVRSYNDTNNNYVTRQFDGEMMTFPGKVPDDIIKFRKHQRDGVARIVQDRTALLDHVVGSGKTFTVIAAAMELRRTGLAKKPMIAVPNHLVKQWAADFYKLYPGANILTATKKDFEKSNRRKFLAKIATGDWDAVIIAHSSYGFIKPDPVFEKKFNEDQVANIMRAIKEVEAGDGDKQQKKRTVKQLEGIKERLENRIKALRDKPMDALLDFGQLGVDQLFVDEAHMFKNLMFTTKMQNIAGLGDSKGSQRAYDMYVKANQIYNQNGRGQGVVFATGTPVSNSLAEMYHMMRYLMPTQMKEMGFESFDAWANTFASVEQVWMQKASGDGFKAQNRMSNFVNTTELLKIFDQVSDTVTMDDVKQAFSDENNGAEFPLPKLKGGKRTPVSLVKSSAQDTYMADIARRALVVENRRGPPQKGDDNILVIMSDARKAAMDVRLVDPEVTEREPGGRIDRSSQEIFDRYQKYDKVKGTQIVFSDLGTPIKSAKKELAEYQALQERINASAEDGLMLRASMGDEDAQGKIDDAEDAQAELDDKGKDWLGAMQAAARGFSIYDDLKAALIERGIPETEIAFIHDYNTDEQKAGLFRKMNSGQIRVLMGSTPKLGAGTNVQERLVALHHLDVPWKPSDVEQREGRIIRQGNKLDSLVPGFEVEILAYVTQDTLDMRMWQVQETKLRMINQLRTRKIDRNIENAFEDLELSAGEMQAAATGNMDLLREIQLRADIKKVEQRKRAFDAQRSDLQSRKRNNAQKLATLPSKIESSKPMADASDQYKQLLADQEAKFSVTIDGKEYTDAKVAGPLLLEMVNSKVYQLSEGDAKYSEKKYTQAEFDALPQEKKHSYKESPAPLSVNVDGVQYKSRDKLLEAFANIRGDKDPISWNLDGKTLIRRSVIETTIRQSVADAIAEEQQKDIGALGPFAVTVEGYSSRNEKVIDVALTVNGKTISNSRGLGKADENTAQSSVRSIVNMADNMAIGAKQQHEYEKRQLQQALKEKSELDSAEEIGEWPDQPKLDELRRKYQEVLRRLSGAQTAKSAKSLLPLKPERMPPLDDTMFSRRKGPVFSRGAQTQANAEVSKIVDAIRANWDNAPEIVVAFDMQDPIIPERVRQEDQKQRSGGAAGTPEGFYYKGKVYLMSSQLPTPNDVARVLFHETLGHYGLRGHFGGALKPMLQQIVTFRKALVEAKMKEYGLRNVSNMDRLVAAEEVLAEMAQRTPEIGFVKRAIAAIRNWLRANVPGFQSMKMTDNDIIQQFILPARAFVERGAGNAGGMTMFSRGKNEGMTNTNVVGNQGGRSADDSTPGDVTDFSKPSKKWGELFFGDATTEKVSELQKWLKQNPNAKIRMYHGTSILNDIKNQGVLRTSSSRKNSLQSGAGYSYWSIYPGQAKTFGEFGSANRGSNSKGEKVAVYFTDFSVSELLADVDQLKNRRQFAGDSVGNTLAESLVYGKGARVKADVSANRVNLYVAKNESTAPDSGGAVFSRSTVSGYTKHATDKLNEAFNHPGTMSMWHKTVGSMYNLAERSTPFKRVFDAAQSFIQDVSFYATEAADLAPKILPKLDTWKDMLKTPVSSEDNKAISAPILQGTLSWARNEAGEAVRIEVLEEAASKLTIDQKSQRLLRGYHISEGVLKMWRGLPIEQYEAMIESKFKSAMLKPGVVFTDVELVKHFSLNKDQIILYREFRSATDKSLDNLAKADLLRFGGKDVEPLRDMVMDAATADDAAVMLRDYLHSQRDLMPDRADDLTAAATGMIDRADKVNKLKKEGYAPLSRFGRYSVDVVVDGERQYFSLFESKQAANLMAMKLKTEFGASNVAQGTMSQKEFEQFQGITPESLELFGNMLGLDSTGNEAQDKAFQTYLKLTKSNRSAMKRMIHRKGTTGFSEDIGRVLAAFVYSNARQTSAALHMGELGEAVNDIPKGQGELKDAAIDLSDYIKKPREEAQALRGMLFAQYLGGSVASALVNFTQPLTVSFPYLSQFGGAAKSGAALMQAMKDQRAGKVLEAGLAQSLRKAEEEGVVSPQSVHELMAQAQGRSTLNAGDGTRLGDAKAFAQNNFAKLTIGWGKLFGLAEQINRRSTFIAAYRIAVDQKIANPGAFATKAVNETQFISNKANKAKFGRGAIGATLMTFKSYSINYLELLHRMATQNGPEGKKAAALMLGMLFLMAGAGGLPFDDDLEDLADFLAQRLGYNFSSKKAKQEFLENLFGKAMAQFIDKGISGLPGSPIDTSGRMSMGNMIPGTGLLLTKRDHTGDLKELAGPVGDLIQRGFQGADKLLSGDVAGAAKAIAPKAVYNALKGADMYGSGAYNDDKGYKVISSTPFEAAMKAIGFQPASVADVQQSNYLNQRAKDFYSVNSQAITAKWAKGIYEKDSGQIADAKGDIAAWNEKNPDQRMRPNMSAILKRVHEMHKDKAQRIADTAPKAMRAQMKRELATAG